MAQIKSLNSNTIKTIACFSMALDHIGFLLFPQFRFLRYVGRLAMPIFAFFISEGCRKTSNTLSYFLRTWLLAILCQSAYILEGIFSGGIHKIYLNILFTLSLSILVTASYLDLEKAIKKGDKKNTIKASFTLLGVFIIMVIIAALCDFSAELFGIKITLDYGFFGILLPLFAALSQNRHKRLLLFSLGILLYCLGNCESIPYIWYTFFALPFLLLYKGERGSQNLKYFFYLFYPLHLVAIYIIKLLFF